MLVRKEDFFIVLLLEVWTVITVLSLETSSISETVDILSTVEGNISIQVQKKCGPIVF